MSAVHQYKMRLKPVKKPGNKCLCFDKMHNRTVSTNYFVSLCVLSPLIKIYVEELITTDCLSNLTFMFNVSAIIAWFY